MNIKTSEPKSIVAACILFALAVTSHAQSPSNSLTVYNSVQAFLATLTSTQSNTTMYSLLLTNARNWSNLPISLATRNGLRFDSLSAAQQTAMLNVATNALGDNGAWLFNEIRAADGVLATVQSSSYSSNYYYIAFVGTPSTNSPWVLQLGGHHIAYNIPFNTTNVSATPFFLGIEPKVWTNNSVVHAPLTNKFSAVLALRQSLSTSALLSGTYSDIVFGANGSGNHDNYPQTYPTSGRGQSYTNLTAAQQLLVKAVIESWLTNTSPAVYAELKAIYESDLALSQTYVGYSGSDTTLVSSSGNYVRVDGPRVWIEWSCQNGIVYSGIHYHTIWRDKLSDYGSSFGVCTTNVPVSIATQPTNRTASAGSSTTFTVGVSGTAPFVYQWYKGSTAISGETNASYTISSMAAGDAGTYSVYVLNNVGQVTSTNATLTVNTANAAPMLNAVSDRTITPGTSLSITNVASDSDSPAQTLTFALLNAPTNATLGSSSGVLAWRPLISQASSTNAFSVSVTDSGSPSMSATQSFSVIVSAATAPSNTVVSYTGGTYQFSVGGIAGPDYIIQASTNLSTWETVSTTTPTSLPFNYTDAAANNYPVRFFRVLLGP